MCAPSGGSLVAYSWPSGGYITFKIVVKFVYIYRAYMYFPCHIPCRGGSRNSLRGGGSGPEFFEGGGGGG